MEPRAEQTFFDDPALDRAVGMIMALAAELYVVRDRQRCLERILESKGFLETGVLDGFKPSPEEAAKLAAERDAFVKSLMEPVLGRQASKGAV